MITAQFTNVTWQSIKFAPENVVSQYGKLYSNGEVAMYDVDIHHKTIREWGCLVNDLPEDVQEKLKRSDPTQAFGSVSLWGMTLKEREAERRKK